MLPSYLNSTNQSHENQQFRCCQKFPTCFKKISITKFPSLLCCCSVAKLCQTLCNPMDHSTPGFPVLHYLLEFAQTHVHGVSDAILRLPQTLQMGVKYGRFSIYHIRQWVSLLPLQINCIGFFILIFWLQIGLQSSN